MKRQTQLVIQKTVPLQKFTCRARKQFSEDGQGKHIWQLHEGLHAKGAVTAWTANAVRALRKSASYFRPGLPLLMHTSRKGDKSRWDTRTDRKQSKKQIPETDDYKIKQETNG